jgi:cell division protein ZapA
MGQANVIVNGRSYPLQCADGDEVRLQAVAAYVGGKVDALVAEFGQVGDERLLLLAALLTADELFDLRERRDAEVAAVSAEAASPSGATTAMPTGVGGPVRAAPSQSSSAVPAGATGAAVSAPPRVAAAAAAHSGPAARPSVASAPAAPNSGGRGGPVPPAGPSAA